METINHNSSVVEPSNVATTVVYCTVVCLLIITGAVGNILVLLSVCFISRLRSWVNALIVNLAITDLMVSVITMPTLLVRLFYEDMMRNSPGLCNFIFQLNLTLVMISTTTLGISSMNRYVLITKPRYVYNQYCGRNTIVKTLASIWATSIVFVFVPTSLFDLVDYIPANRFCHFMAGNPVAWWYGTLILLVYVIGVMAIIAVSSVLTFRKITTARKRATASSERSQSSQDSTNRPRRHLTRQECIITRMMVIVCLAFSLCTLPYCISHALSYHEYSHGILLKISVLLSLSNSCINPVIYAGSNRFFREAFIEIITLRCLRQA